MPRTMSDICHKRAMAAPRNRLGAHQDGRRCSLRELDGAVERCGECLRLHVVGVAAEACVAPAEIDRITVWMAQAAEIFHVDVADSDALQGLGKRVRVELRIAARFRDGADIEELPDGVRAQQIEEFVDRACGVADGENRERTFFARGNHGLAFHHSARMDAHSPWQGRRAISASAGIAGRG